MSEAVNTYEIGDAVRCTTSFRNDAGQLFDPTTVKFSYKRPDETVITKIFGTDAEIVKDAVGKYRIDVAATAAGEWFYRWFSEGNGQAAAERAFKVRRSNFV